MLIWTRKRGSQRRSPSRKIRPELNFAGQGGLPYIAFWDDDKGNWICIQPENITEVRELQSQAAILAHNVKDN